MSPLGGRDQRFDDLLGLTPTRVGAMIEQNFEYFAVSSGPLGWANRPQQWLLRAARPGAPGRVHVRAGADDLEHRVRLAVLARVGERSRMLRQRWLLGEHRPHGDQVTSRRGL